MFFFVAQYLQLVLGLSPLTAGLWGLPSFGGFILGSLSIPALVKKIRPVFVMAFGFTIAAIGFACLLFVQGVSALATLVTGFTLFSLGISPVFTLATDVVIGSAPPERAGIASSLSETGSELGGALGIAMLGSIGALIYRKEMMSVIPGGKENLAVSIDTLGGAVVTASQLSPGQASELLNFAREAFTNSMHYAAGISALISIAMAILCVAILRKV